MKLLALILYAFTFVGCSPVTGLYVVNFAEGWRNYERDGERIEVIPEAPRLGYLNLKGNHQAVFTAQQGSQVVPAGKAKWKLDRDTLSVIFRTGSQVIDGKRFPKSQVIKRYWFTYASTDSSKRNRMLVALDGGKTYYAYTPYSTH